MRSNALLALGEPRATSELDRFVTDGLRAPQPRVRYLALSRAAMLAVMAGRFEEAEKFIAEAKAFGNEIEEPDVDNVWFAQLGDLRMAQGRRFELLDEERSSTPQHLNPTALTAFTALVHLEQGDGPEVQALSGKLLEIDPHAVEQTWASLPMLTIVARVAAAVARRDACRRVYDALLPLTGIGVVNAGAVGFLGTTSHYLGLLARALDRPDAARAHFEEALHIHERLGARPWTVRTGRELASVLLAEPASEEEGRALLEKARITAERIGMAWADGRTAAERSISGNRFSRDGATWTIAYRDKTVRIKDAKGLRDIAALLAAPGRQIHAAELVAASGSGVPGRVDLSLGSDAVIDERARREYRARLAALDEELADAESNNDPERAARAKEERDTLAHELATALGLGGRSRWLGDASEKARKAVTARIRDSLVRIDRIHPRLAEHLRDSIRTGTFCSYSPSKPVEWRL
jgi:tetratricopeptide (TPR) repeat protein